MEHHPSNTRIKPILGLCMAQECTHMSDTVFLLCPDLKKKERKKNRPTDPPDFQAKRANKPFIF